MGFVICALICLVAVVLGVRPMARSLALWGKPNRVDWALASFTGLAIAGLLLPLCTWSALLTDGLLPDYGTGRRHAVVASCETRGVFWKTNECELFFTGADGEQAGMKSTSVSVPDEHMPAMMQATKRSAEFQMKCWLIMPYRLGNSNCLVTGVTFEEVSK